jgi:hypothetical protein
MERDLTSGRAHAGSLIHVDDACRGTRNENTDDPLQPARSEPRTRAAVDFQDDKRSLLDRSSGGVPAYPAQQPLGCGRSMAWPRGRPARLDPRMGRRPSVRGRRRLVPGNRLRDLPRRGPPVPEPGCGRPLDRRPDAARRTWIPAWTPGPERSICPLGEDLNAEGQCATRCARATVRSKFVDPVRARAARSIALPTLRRPSANPCEAGCDSLHKPNAINRSQI